VTRCKCPNAELPSVSNAVQYSENVRNSLGLNYKLDRLGRSLQHLAQLIGEFETHPTALVATSQGIDTSESNPAGRLQKHVLAAVAEFERSVIRERINAGLAAARERGTILGRPRTLHRHATAVAKSSRRGLSGRKIAAKLNIPSGSVFAVLKNVKRNSQ
jgi:DNA invertase Pin-like site-specific DNA recombinase